MGLTLSGLMASPSLALTRLTPGPDTDPIDWAHSSDLDDPSPFLQHGQMLLTTGRQFQSFDDADDYVQYVRRLSTARVVALGFGTEVVQSGAPPELIAACEAMGLPLVEVPYATPFIAVSKHIADARAAQSRQELEWALNAQDSISKAVLSSGGLAAAVRVAESVLGSEIAIVDPDGAGLEGHAPPTWLRERALDLLRRGSRARDQGEDREQFWIAQTLGRSRTLLGAMTFLRPVAVNAVEGSVLTMVAALVELALEHADDQRLGFRSISPLLFAMLRRGEPDAVASALRSHVMTLPREPLTIIAMPIAELGTGTRDSLERMSSAPEARVFPVEHDGMLVLIVESSTKGRVAARLSSERVRAGVGAAETWNDLDEGLRQASAALRGAGKGAILAFHDLRSGAILGLLEQAEVVEIAELRLAGLCRTADGRELLEQAVVWLDHNGSWERAAQDLVLHRHTLKQRMALLERETGLPLATFQGRAALWAMLVALDLMKP